MLLAVGAAVEAFGAEPPSGLPGQPGVASNMVLSVSKQAPQREDATLARELQTIQDALPGKKRELARLRHKWLVAKGRTPSAQEVQDFEQKRAKGATTVADNPYINRNPLSTPAYARTAYFKKLEEIKQDEERILRLEKALGEMHAVADSAGDGRPTGQEGQP